MENYYEVLEVNRNASQDTIKKIFKIHIKKNHPDLFSGIQKEEAEIKVKKINEAYEILSDPEKRKEYDNYLNNQEQDNIQELNDLKKETVQLKKKLNQKEQIIQHFLGDMDLTEFEQNIEDIPSQKKDLDFNYETKAFVVKIIIAVVIILALVFTLYRLYG